MNNEVMTAQEIADETVARLATQFGVQLIRVTDGDGTGWYTEIGSWTITSQASRAEEAFLYVIEESTGAPSFADYDRRVALGAIAVTTLIVGESDNGSF